MPRIDQFNIAIYSQDDADSAAEVHRIIDHYIADHRGTTKFAALHSLLLIADTALSKKHAHQEKEKREEKEVGSATARRGQMR